MKIKIFLITFFLITFSSSVGFSSKTAFQESYNKPLSVFLSTVNPGLGQIYSGQTTKGLIFWTTSAVLTGGFLITIADLNFYSPASPLPLNMGFQLKEELSPNEKKWAWGLGIAYAVFYIYNIMDISLYSPEDDEESLALGMDHESIQFNYSLKF